ncbi:MAG: hypothetical protein E7406_07565 [Ruminococcaceae bacterium]|nr:hypothetical protein [Oscillospiraceae bacterium]
MQDNIDKNLVIENTSFDENMKVHDVTKEPFKIYGNSKSAKNIFARMNENAAEKVSVGVKNRGARSSGVRIRFKTDSKRFGIRADLSTTFHAGSLTSISALGFDIYSGNKFIKSVFPDDPAVKPSVVYEQVVDLEGDMSDITVYLPYNAVVNSLFFALDKGATVLPAENYRDLAPIVFYGSSITHGFCVSRPGITFTAKIGRNLNMDYRNLGFSGAARGEEAMAEYIASLNKSVIVCEYDHNEPSAEELSKRHLPFYKKIRETDKNTPILFLSRPDERDANEAHKRMKVVEATYKYALENGDKNVYFIDGLTLFPDDIRYDCTVDAVHPNDLGAHMIAEKLTEKLWKILSI